MRSESKHEITKERLYLYAPAAYILMKVEFQSYISAEVLQAAIERATAKQATLCSRVEQDQDGTAYFVPCKPVHTCIKKMEPDETLKTVMQQEIRTPFDIEHGEWMRHYSTEENGRSIWLLVCHHMVGDGLSVMFFIRDVQSALQDITLKWERQPFYLCSPDSLGGKLPAPMRWGMHAFNKQWEKKKQIFGPNDRVRMTNAYWKGRVLSMMHTTVEKELLERILTACRSHNVTLTAAWLAAILLISSDTIDAGIAVNIRPSGFDGMANWATGISIKYISKDNDFWIAAQDVYRLMHEKMESADKRNFLMNFLQALSPTLIDAAYFSAFDGFENSTASKVRNMFGYNGCPKGCSITNLLRAPLETNSIEHIEFYPPMVPNAQRLFGMVTVNDRLEITLQSFESEEETTLFLDSVLKRIVKEL